MIRKSFMVCLIGAVSIAGFSSAFSEPSPLPVQPTEAQVAASNKQQAQLEDECFNRLKPLIQGRKVISVDTVLDYRGAKSYRRRDSGKHIEFEVKSKNPKFTDRYTCQLNKTLTAITGDSAQKAAEEKKLSDSKKNAEQNYKDQMSKKVQRFN